VQIKIGFTGTGYISKIHALAAQKLPDVQLTAVVNHRRESMAEFAKTFNISRQYQNITALLQDGDIDAVVISTPNYLHASETIAALKAGVHVMVEKPMAMNAIQAAEMFTVSQETGALLMVAHCWRFDPEVLWMQRQIKDGHLGKIIHTTGYGVHTLWGPSGWFTQKRYAGGGAMADVGIHALDTVRFWLGDPQPVSVYARIGTYYKDLDVDDTGITLVNWDNGATSYIESGWWQPHADGQEAATRLYGTGGFGQIYPTFISSPQGKEDPGFAYPREPHAPQSLYDDQLAYFIQCIRTGQQPNPGGMEGWINMKVIDAAYESAQTGQVVEVA
jgi:predicted dehydrogenase